MKTVETTLPHLYLKPGEMAILDQPAVVSTILGSCIAIALFNKQSGIAALAHALLPHCKKRVYVNSVNDLLAGDCLECPEAFRYVDCCVSMMAEAFLRIGASLPETQARIYGGAQMFMAQDDGQAAMSVGRQNVAVAKKVISDHGMSLTLADVGGQAGRKIYFHTPTGKVFVQNAPTNDALNARIRRKKHA